MYKINDKGFLSPIERIDISLIDFEKFSNDFNSEQRNKLMEAFSQIIELFKSKCENQFNIWVKGSFTTKKKKPNDIDLIVFLNPEDKNNLENYISKIYQNSDKWNLDIEIKGIDLNQMDEEQQVLVNSIESLCFNGRDKENNIIENCSGYFNIIF